uniref:Cytochrome b n=1 Tax=Syrbatus sp. 1 RRMO-2024a TaxID=3154167 RepID=A0AAU7LKL3_9COLE
MKIKYMIILKSLFKMNMINLKSPSNLSKWWNFGALLSLFMIIQISSGFFLSMFYINNINYTFYSIININRNINNGWLIRSIHMNGASFIFIYMYIHMSRSLFFNSFFLKQTWTSGMMIFIIMMMTAFMGYILPWGQMSFWGATVITNLLSTIPYLGNMITNWLWGGFSINNATLLRFYSFHFILPFMIMSLIMIHITFLHYSKSNNSLNLNYYDMISLYPYFLIKDMNFFMMSMFIFIMNCLLSPYFFTDPENFTPSNPLNTPIHIQPEWYFLFAYTILRTIPNKLGGVIALSMSIISLMILPMINFIKMNSSKFNPLMKINFWMFSANFLMLSWMGTQPIEMPFTNINQLLTFMYFMFFIMKFIY